MKTKQKSRALALCGMLGALTVALMLLGAAIPLLLFIAPACGGILVMLAAEECGGRLAATLYAAASLLGVLFVPDKEVPLVYVFLLGYYPLVKPRLDAIRRRGLRVLAKSLLYYAAIGLMYGLLYLLFPVPAAGTADLAAALLAGSSLLMGHGAFLLFDRALTNLLRAYRLLWRRRLHHMLGL